MDFAFVLAVVTAFLAMILAMLFLCWVEMRWHARQREELTHLLIFSLFRLSKRHAGALQEPTRRRIAREDATELAGEEEKGEASDEGFLDRDAEEATSSKLRR